MSATSPDFLDPDFVHKLSWKHLYNLMRFKRDYSELWLSPQNAHALSKLRKILTKKHPALQVWTQANLKSVCSLEEVQNTLKECGFQISPQEASNPKIHEFWDKPSVPPRRQFSGMTFLH